VIYHCTDMYVYIFMCVGTLGQGDWILHDWILHDILNSLHCCVPCTVTHLCGEAAGCYMMYMMTIIIFTRSDYHLAFATNGNNT
jgi:hypothetical protein